MKTLLLTLSFFVLTTFVKGQDVLPADTAKHALPTYSFSYYTRDSSVFIYKGVKYGYTKLISNRKARQLIDSLDRANTGLFKLKTDSIAPYGFTSRWRTQHVVDSLSALKLKLDQTSPQTIANGVPLMTTAVISDGSQNQLVNKAYVDLAVSSVNLIEYFSKDSLSPSVTGYYSMNNSQVTHETIVSPSITGTSGSPTSLFKFMTPVDHPHLDRFLAGAYESHFHMSRQAGGVVAIRFDVWQCDATGTHTALLGTSADLQTFTTTPDLYELFMAIATEVPLALTDRISIEFLGWKVSGSNTTVTLSVGGAIDSYFGIKTNPTELEAIFEEKSNKVTTLSSGSTDIQYPSAKLVYDQLGLKVDKITNYGLVRTTLKDSITTAEQHGDTLRNQGHATVYDVSLKQDALTNPVTGTGTGGQVAFWNGTSTQTGDAGLFWDNTNKRLGIKTASSPNANLDIRGTVGSQIARFTNTAASSSSAGAGMIGYSDDGAALASGDRLGFFLLGGSIDASHTLVQSVGMHGYTSEAWSATNQGAYLTFETTPTGSTTADREERWRITSNGSLSNTTSAGTSGLHLKAGTATASTAPLKLNVGTPLTIAEAGVINHVGNTTDSHFTVTPYISSTATEKTLAYTDGNYYIQNQKTSAQTAQAYINNLGIGTFANGWTDHLLSLKRVNATSSLVGGGLIISDFTYSTLEHFASLTENQWRSNVSIGLSAGNRSASDLLIDSSTGAAAFSSSVSAVGALSTTSTAASITTTTGSGIFGGGIGVAGNGNFGGGLAVGGSIGGAYLISGIETGVAPIVVSSTTLNVNLNADMVDGVHVTSLPVVSSGTSAPESTPGKVGDIYIDTTGKKIYVSTGTTTSSDWTILN